MMGGHHVLEEVARNLNETPSSVLSVRTLTALCRQNQCELRLSAEGERSAIHGRTEGARVCLDRRPS